MRKAAAFIAAILGIGGLSVAVAQTTTKPPLGPSPAAAQVPTPPTTPANQAAHPLTADDVNAWLDGFMPYAIARGDIPGAVVVVVKDGQVLTEKGYGYANVAKKIKVDPKTTLVRPGSISKLFTWTALMQQVQAGKVDLNADVNNYIDFKIPPYKGQPIKVINLMTHTPGFEEAVKDLISLGPKEIPYDTLLKRWVPNRIYAPGTTPAYSNYGASLAGYIVQRTSGEPFDAYLEHHIVGHGVLVGDPDVGGLEHHAVDDDEVGVVHRIGEFWRHDVVTLIHGPLSDTTLVVRIDAARKATFKTRLLRPFRPLQ